MAQRPARTTLERVIAALAAPGTLLMLLAFFMPWYSVTCGGMTLATGSGYDVATSGLHAPRTSEPAPAMGQIPPPAGTTPRTTGDGAPMRDAWLVLFPLCALVALGAFAGAWISARPRVGLLVAGGAAIVATLVPVAHALVLHGRLHDAVAARTGANPAQRDVASALERSVVSHLENGWYLAVFAGLFTLAAAVAWWFAAPGRRPGTAPH
ncbi:MAG: hypothetical protein WCJ30_02720 [Deltaproteobacteria bacterium]